MYKPQGRKVEHQGGKWWYNLSLGREKLKGFRINEFKAFQIYILFADFCVCVCVCPFVRPSFGLWDLSTNINWWTPSDCLIECVTEGRLNSWMTDSMFIDFWLSSDWNWNSLPVSIFVRQLRWWWWWRRRLSFQTNTWHTAIMKYVSQWLNQEELQF